MDAWLPWLIVVAAIVIGLPLLVWISHRMLTTSHADGTGGSGGSDAFGGFVDAFEPARARADADLESHNTMRQQLPAPGDDPGPPQIIDGTSIRIRRPRPTGAAPDTTGKTDTTGATDTPEPH